MPAPADLVLSNGNLITVDAARSHATAMAIRDGVIVAIGDARDVDPFIAPATRRIDLAGKTVVPGFHDCHLHLLWFGRSLVAEASLTGCASIDEVCDRLATFDKTSGAPWIRGHGFDQDKLAEGRFPTRAELDRVSRTRPVFITRVCGHAAVANSVALAMLSVAERAAGDGETGLFTEGDIDAFHRRVPAPSEDDLERALLAACDVALASGITSVGTLLDTVEQYQAFTRLRAKLGRLPVRMTMMPPQASIDVMTAAGLPFGAGDDWLRVGGAKFFSDGSLGARTALLDAPYADDPAAGVGLRIYPAEELKRRCGAVASQGWQLVIHAIGDAAVRESIDAIEFALDGAPNTRRHRIEHVSICPPAQLERMARLKIGATLQPQFITSDTWTGERVGPDRARHAYPFASLRRAGVPIGLSSDAPVETLDAFACLAAAVGRHAWTGAAEALTPLEAIEAYTRGSAFVDGCDASVGSLAIGKLADFVVLSADPTAMTGNAIRTLRAERIFVGGDETGTRREENNSPVSPRTK